jgi:hypothetical protein
MKIQANATEAARAAAARVNETRRFHNAEAARRGMARNEYASYPGLKRQPAGSWGPNNIERATTRSMGGPYGAKGGRSTRRHRRSTRRHRRSN